MSGKRGVRYKRNISIERSEEPDRLTQVSHVSESSESSEQSGMLVEGNSQN